MDINFNSEYKRVTAYEAKPGTFDKVLLLYSGGLDTSVMLKWIQDHYGAEVHALCIDIGQREDFEPIVQKAFSLGAKTCTLVDLKEKFAIHLLSEAILFNADYEGGYHLFCPLGRIMIAAAAVEYAQKMGINVICHGATGKGNDQIRFDSYITTLDPNIKILAPVREWSLGRDEEIEYAKQHNIPVSASLEKIYSYDENLWGCSAEGAEIEDFKQIPPLHKILKFTSDPEQAPDKPELVKITFTRGIPTQINDQTYLLEKLIKIANSLGARHGLGITHLIEDRVIGLKVRGIYEEPGAELLIKAHSALEKTVSTREEIDFKELVDKKWSELVYQGRYFHPLVRQLLSFTEQLNRKVEGTVTMKLYKGRCEAVAIDSKYSLNNENSSFLKDSFNQGSSAGFIEHFNYTQKLSYNLSIKK